MKDQNLLIRKEVYHQLYDRIWSIGYEGWNQWYSCYLFVEEECQEQYYQNSIRISTHYSTKVTQEIEDSNYISRTVIIDAS